MRKFGLILVAASAAFAQPVVFGVKGGSPLNDAEGGRAFLGFSSPGRWTGGPTADVRLPWGFSVEASALYRSHRQNGAIPFSFGPDLNSFLASTSQKSKAWDFPVLLKYRFLRGPVRPYVGAGYAWSHQTSTTEAYYTCLGGAGTCAPPDFPLRLGGSFTESSGIRRGPAASAGFEFRAGGVLVSPEVRYTHLMHPNADQVTAMVGFTFGPKIFSFRKRRF